MALHSIKKKGQNAFQFAHFPPVDRKNAFNYSASALHFNRNYYNFISWFKEKIKKGKESGKKFESISLLSTHLWRNYLAISYANVHHICQSSSGKSWIHLPLNMADLTFFRRRPQLRRRWPTSDMKPSLLLHFQNSNSVTCHVTQFPVICPLLHLSSLGSGGAVADWNKSMNCHFILFF